MWHDARATRSARVDRPTQAATSRRSASAASTRRSCRSTRSASRSRRCSCGRTSAAPTTRSRSWRATRTAFMTFVERHGIPPIGSGLSLGHILLLPTRPARRARADRGVRRGDGLRHRAPDRSHHRDAAQRRSCSSCATTARSARPQYDDDLVKLRRRRPDPASRRSSRSTTAVGTLLPDGRRPSSACPRARPCTRARTTPPPSRSRPARSRRAGPASRSARRACSSTRSPTSASISNTRSCRCPARTRDRYVVCAENGLGGKVLEHVLRQRRVRGRRARRPHASTMPFAALDAAAARDRARRRRRDVPAVAAAARSAPQGSATMRGGFVHMSLETTRRDLVRAVVEGVAHNLALAAAARRGVHRRTRSTRSRSSAARPARGRGARSSPTSLDRPVRRARRARRRRRARDRAARARTAGAWSRADLDHDHVERRTRYEPDPAAPQPVRRPSSAVRGRVRCPPPDQ